MYKRVFLVLMFLLAFSPNTKLGNAQVIHEVKQGDSLFKISDQYKVNKDELAKLNGLSNNSKLVLGQSILIPGSTYFVRPGDSIWNIATRHTISENRLLSVNNLKTRVL